MDIDQGIIETLEDGYGKATFFVEDEFGKSEKTAAFRNQARLSAVTIFVCRSHDMHSKRY